MFAGFDTTSTTMSWLIYLLARHPDKQTALYEELVSAMGREETPNADTVATLPFLRACVNEAMRLMPAVTDTVRMPTRDDVLPASKTFVPKGELVVPFHAVAMRDRSFWGSDADDFVPERWLDPSLKHRLDATPGAFTPFALGRRNCIGKDFAMHSLLLATAAVFRAHEFQWPTGQSPVETVHVVVMKAKTPPRYIVKRRV